MHFISEVRYNPQTGEDQKYYRIKESFRDATGRVRSNIMLNVGFLEQPIDPYDIAAIGRGLTYRFDHRNDGPELFNDTKSTTKPIVQQYVDKFWKLMVEQGSIDAVNQKIKKSEEKARDMIDSSTMKHTDAREVGAEWLAFQAIKQLQIERFLHEKGWDENHIKDAVTCLITRTVYPVSEHKSIDIMHDNSAVCELVYGEQNVYPSYRSVYDTPDRLYNIKSDLERHLCNMTDDLFNQTNKILLFDLTNFYFEGRKSDSNKAKFGRSKEKRSDCKLLVLALCINTSGFIRYSSVLEGNTADPDSLPDMIDKVVAASPIQKNEPERALIVIDAGIASEKNLEIIKSKGYNYLCVSRKRLTDVELCAEEESVVVHDTLNREIRLAQVKHEEGGDYFLQVNSPAKALTESSMNRQWRARFEDELQRAKDGLTKKGGTKTYEKVVERVGRAMAHYPSVAKFYTITYKRSTKDETKMSSLSWEIKVPENIDTECGKYYLRTNVATLDERTCWDYYNLIREIECTNRQLKTDLNLRPIYHRTDERAESHLFMGMLSYWVVNTIRYQLKLQGERCFWTEIVRRMSTQKLVTTEAFNGLGEKVYIRQCTEPKNEAKAIYTALRYKDRPFIRKKICSTQHPPEKNYSPPNQEITP